ncbi:cupin domain-containing protein [Alteromonas oceanisediminis]|uniref:cupin domain-containing protein n=1 Tax=Alteromonas oceanisediminis TaxID=2836180 RepID=UPI001BDA13C0|nr:cupin domain-containing protein [Alteromonas oceanisediminis]MBT0586910.1 cupin domain-containing protein [Alteromonas oceanisediminis]
MQSIIDQFKLKPHPEGGYYGEVYRSPAQVESQHHGKSRPALTHIYFLLTHGECSRFHRVWHDEVWNFYAGAPLSLYEITCDDGQLCQSAEPQMKSITIGAGADYVHIIRAGHWQAAETSGDYSFVGCSVAPGFDFEDFSFMESEEDKAWLKQHRPEWQRFI